MTIDYNSKAARKLLHAENKNITEKNPLEEFGKALCCILIVLMFLYLSIYVATGAIISSLSIDAQIKLENALTALNKPEQWKTIEENPSRIVKLKKKIMSYDEDYPIISNQKIYIIEMNMINAFCAPNGNIYITNKLYKKLDTDEKLVYILAHEMAHYKNKDHLTALRKNISKMVLILSLSLCGDNNKITKDLLSDSISLNDLHHARLQEIKADTYAGTVLMQMFGTTQSGVEVLEFLSKNSKLSFSMTATHPKKEERIELLKSLE